MSWLRDADTADETKSSFRIESSDSDNDSVRVGEDESLVMRQVDRLHVVSRGELKEMAASTFGDLVKAVVDVQREVMVVDAELHSDQEALLLDEGSKQSDLWGINLYPDLLGEDFVEFDSMINLRPSQSNRTRGVEEPTLRRRILQIVGQLVGE